MMPPNLNVLSKEWGRLSDVESLADAGYLKPAGEEMSQVERARHVLSRNGSFKRKEAQSCLKKVEELVGTSSTPKTSLPPTPSTASAPSKAPKEKTA